MAEDKIEFELVSPEKLLVSKPVDMVVVPGSEGDMGVLPRHAPVISTVRPGLIRIYEGREVRERLFVAGGFVEVTPARCTVLADEATPVEEMDRASYEKRLAEARDDLKDAKDEGEQARIRERIAVCEAALKSLEM